MNGEKGAEETMQRGERDKDINAIVDEANKARPYALGVLASLVREARDERDAALRNWSESERNHGELIDRLEHELAALRAAGAGGGA